MSYLALARKWRPRNFADLVGQGHVVQALTNALGANRLHHAYLFSGTRGVGKTTIARIFAKALNCEQGVVAEPCGRCGACLEIDEGRFVDLIEVDAASRTRVDDTREILDNVQYAPARGRYKVYLIDEVHMLSAHSFNALLKTLEEPPEHVKFLLATTDPQKLPVTVLSRCLQFNLKRLPHRLIGERLERICADERIGADAAALALLARAANGSMRDGLSLLDQAIAFGGGEVREAQTREILGTVERRDVEQLLDTLLAGDAAGLLAACEHIDEQFPDYGRLLDELASVLQRIAVWQVAGRVDAGDGEDTSFIEKAAADITAADVQLYYQTALIGKRDLELAPDVRSGFEMT
ncbi:MAG: DNA polymerase III subunit gamma/tau, partial [Pseudomonadota bacterium]